MRYISRTVWILSLISLFTDTASEMLYPIMPIYLRTIGFSIVLIGILEGVAEATAGLSKGYFGKLSDTSGRRVPFVQIGYVFSAISKPMMAIFTFPFWIFLQGLLIVLARVSGQVQEMPFFQMKLRLRPKGKYSDFIVQWTL